MTCIILLSTQIAKDDTFSVVNSSNEEGTFKHANVSPISIVNLEYILAGNSEL